MDANSPLAFYIHFPYCKSRCPYCDFFRHLKPRDFDETALVKRYAEDIAYFADLLGSRKIKSIFFGGGTPSILSAVAVENILHLISDKFLVMPEAEISLEANPNTFEQQKFVDFHAAGINRLSLGVQALNRDDLKFLGRTHSLDDALQAIELGQKTFEKFSIDLIYARPSQTWESWQKEIDLALSFGLKHISLYELSIEENTPFYQKNIQALDEEKAAKLYEQTIFYMNKRGLERYEVSNFAFDEALQSIHNLAYWQGDDYIGIGEGAHGRLRLNNEIWTTVDGKKSEKLSSHERAEELILLGLRLKKGINANAFYQACGIPLFKFVNNLAIKRLAQLNLLCYDADNIWLTNQGFLLLDQIVLELVN